MISVGFDQIAYLYNLHRLQSNKLDGYLVISEKEDEIIVQLGQAFDEEKNKQEKMDQLIKLGLKTGIISSNDMSGGAIDYSGAPARLKAGAIPIKVMGPNGSTTWLNTSHINNVMKFYEVIYPNFKFMGAVPQDCFQYSQCNLGKTSFDKLLNEGKTQIGIIFNLDKHNQGGSHWVALWLDLNKGQCYYCDSVGNPPLKDSSEYMDNFCYWYKNKTKKDADKRINTKRYQYDGSECGVYSMNFIIRMLNGEETFDEIINHPLSFKQINACRVVYFDNADIKNKPSAMCDPINLESEKK